MSQTLLLFCILTLSLQACEKSITSKSELQKYVLNDDNGLHKTSTQQNYTIDVLYRPKDLIVEQETEDQHYSVSQTDSIRKRLDSLDYFTMKMTRHGKDILNTLASNPSQFEQALNYLSFQIGTDIKLIAEKDTIPVQDFLYFRGFELNGASEIMLAFKSNLHKRSGNVQFLFQDSFFQTGSHRFEFEAQAIRNIPSLLIN